MLSVFVLNQPARVLTSAMGLDDDFQIHPNKTNTKFTHITVEQWNITVHGSKSTMDFLLFFFRYFRISYPVDLIYLEHSLFLWRVTRETEVPLSVLALLLFPNV